MSFDSIIARSPSIIYRPGGVVGGLVVTTWAQVQQFIAERQGTVIVYVDNSIAAAHVPAASGVTDCQSRVELRAYRQDDVAPTTLTVDSGATLKALLKVAGTLQIFCNTLGATPALDFDYSGGAEPVLFLEDGASVAATGTNPSCVVPGASQLSIGLQESASVFANGAVPLFQVPAGSQLDFFATNSIIGDGVASGAGNVFLFFDTSTVTLGGGNTPVLAGLTGTYGAKLLDPNAIIYKPGSTSFGRTVATWAEVQPFISNLQGTGVVYIDDSIVSPALVPAATGVTNCQGRVTIEPFLADAVRFTTLQIEPGATLQDLAKVNAMELRCNPQNATRSLTFTSPNGGYLFVSDGGMISNAATATQPAFDAPAGMFTTLDLTGLSLIVLNAPAVPLVDIAVGGEFNLFAFDACTIPAGYASGLAGGTIDFFYDNSSASTFPTPGTPPALPGFAGTYLQTNSDNIWAQKQIDPATFNAPVLNAVPVFNGVKWEATTVPSGAITGTPNTVAYFNAAGVMTETPTFLTAIDATGFFLVGATASDNGSSARVQNSNIIANASQFRSNQYGNNAGVPGLSTFKSRGAAIGTLTGLLAGDPIMRITSVGVAPDNASIPLASFITVQVPANFVPAGQNFLPSEYELQLVPLAGPINSRRVVFKVTSEGETQTLRGIRAGGPSTLPTNLTTGTLWSSDAVNPNGTIVGSPGDLFSDTAGGAGATLWVKESGVATNTGWVAAGSTAPLVGNTNGPANANRFNALTQLGNDADVAVTDTAGWRWVRMTGLTANRNVTLPAAPTNGMVVVVKDGDGSLGVGFTITVNGNGNTIDGAATFVMNAANPGSKGAISLQFDSAAPSPGWYLF